VKASHRTRPLRSSVDLDRVCEIMDASFTDELARRGTTVDALVRPLRLMMPILRVGALFSSYVRQRMAGAVSIEEGRPVSVVLMKPMGRDVARWYIGPIATDPAFRRRGHGRAALECAIAQARRMGARFCLLDVETENRAAIGLYERLGFRAYGGWDLLVAPSLERGSTHSLPPGCRVSGMSPADVDVRFTVAATEATEAESAMDPPSRREFELGAVDRLAAWIQIRLARARVLRRKVESGTEIVGWVSARRNRLGNHSVAVHVARAHAEELAEPLVDRALDLLGDAADLPVHARVSRGASDVQWAFQRRGFEVTESNVRLGLHITAPSRDERKETA